MIPEFNDLLNSCVEDLKIEFAQNFVGALQFGSTVNFLKNNTDIDLFILFKSLPVSRHERWEMLKPLENRMQPKLNNLAKMGYHLYFSFLVRTVEEAQHFKSLYLDFPDHSRILYDQNGDIKNLIIKISDWIKKSGAVRIQNGNLWYWDLAPGATYKDIRKVGWE
jgi:hypothetical protein